MNWLDNRSIAMPSQTKHHSMIAASGHREASRPEAPAARSFTAHHTTLLSGITLTVSVPLVHVRIIVA